MLLTNFYNQNSKATTKIIIQMITILILADVIWILLFSTAWEHGGEDAQIKTAEGDHQFWESLWFIHKIVYILAYVELILKGFLLYYLFADYKAKHKWTDLFNFNYDDGKGIPNRDEQPMDFDNSINNFINESSHSYAQNFKNNY